jgi:hypothetical protein
MVSADEVHIRVIRRLGIRFVDAVRDGFSVGRSMNYPVRVGYAILAEDQEKVAHALTEWRQRREARKPKPHPDLLFCIREASRAAHRERDAVQKAYQQERRTLAGNARQRKEDWYRLSERGIVAAHRQGLLRYAGASPQGMAVYEYGEGGMACFHSTLHPAGTERTPVPDHPETLLVEAKEKVRGVSLQRVEVTLDILPSDLSGYERSETPRIERQQPTCFNCGEKGHIARRCPEREGQFEDNYDHAMA